MGREIQSSKTDSLEGNCFKNDQVVKESKGFRKHHFRDMVSVKTLLVAFSGWDYTQS